MKLQVTYDKKADAFAMGRGQVNSEPTELWEAYPWVRLEVGEESGDLLCVEILGASKILGDLLNPLLYVGEEFVCANIEGEMSAIKDALLEPDGDTEGRYKEYIKFDAAEETARDARLSQVRNALAPYLSPNQVKQLAQAHTF